MGGFSLRLGQAGQRQHKGQREGLCEIMAQRSGRLVEDRMCAIASHYNVTWSQSGRLPQRQHCSVAWLPSEWFGHICWQGVTQGTDPPVISRPASGSRPWHYPHWSISSQIDWRVGLKTASFAILHVILQITWVPRSHQAALSQPGAWKSSLLPKKWLHRWKNFINMNSMSLPR